MSNTVISIENVSKAYRLGQIGGGTLREDFARWWAKLRRKPDPFLKIGEEHHARKMGEQFWALDGVSFQVKQGEVLGIIGRNGAGKSTLLKILSQVTTPTSGQIKIKGRIASLLEVGTGFHPELTGRENVLLNGAILGMTKAEIRKKFDEIVAFSEIEEFIDTPVKRYSSGMYVRLAFAVAAHLEPEILICDEVLAVGDVEFQKKCLGKMQDVSQRQGRTVLFVSHNMAAVRNLCNRSVLLVSGQVRHDGDVEEAISTYSASGNNTSGLTWSRPDSLPRSAMAFEKISAALAGRQPGLKLVCNIVLASASGNPPVFIAADICDQLQTPIMQALPINKPFIPGVAGKQHLLFEIDLPPLIPGLYTSDFWIGTHYSSTLDYVKGVIKFEVTDSPSNDRNHPHTASHGFIVPNSRCEFLSI